MFQLEDYPLVTWGLSELDQLGLLVNVWGLVTMPLTMSVIVLALLSPIERRWPFFIFHLSLVFVLVAWTRLGHPVFDIFRGGFLAFSVIQASEVLLIYDPRKVLKLKGQKEAFEDLSLWQQIIWIIQYLISPRGVGWMHEPVRRLPPRSKYSQRYPFVLEQIKWFFCYQFLYELTRIPVFWKPSIPEHRANGYASLNFTWYSYTVTVASLGLFKPEELLPMFGSLRESYTVGRHWGRTWHQLLRFPLEAHGKFAASRIFGFTLGTLPAYFVEICVAFGLSGLAHQIGEYSAFGYWGTGSLRFFLVQIFAIVGENIVIATGKAYGLGVKKKSKDTKSTSTTSIMSWKIVGYMWVFVWMGISGAIIADAMEQGGFLAAPPHINWILGLITGNWTPKPLTLRL
ncbi:hypothetical protein M422DRAFT_246936 [Sphaerobolus stellatus SS14]|nr:hypothetical protein M422DRAFT_246936 [Sphaerobolus stellatus SS14]